MIVVLHLNDDYFVALGLIYALNGLRRELMAMILYQEPYRARSYGAISSSNCIEAMNNSLSRYSNILILVVFAPMHAWGPTNIKK